MSTNYVISQIDEMISRLDRIKSKLNGADIGKPFKWHKTIEVPKSHDGIWNAAFVDVFCELSKVPGKRVRISIEEVGGGEG